MFPWLTPYLENTAEQLVHNAAPHAVLISGGTGVGVDVLARDMAKLALCANPSAAAACGSCKNCKLFSAESHSDFRWLKPEESGKQIKVDDVRALVDFVHGSSLQGGRKVAIIEPVEALNINGANALLKTLEEPAGDTLLILVADRDESVLPTIRSRCQLIQVRPPVWHEAETWLQHQKPDLQSSSVQSYLKLACGEPITALDYVEIDALKEQEQMLAALAAVLKDELAVSALASKWCDDLIRLRLEWVVHWLEQLIRSAALNSEEHILHPAAVKMFRYLAERLESEQLHAARLHVLTQLAALNSVSNPNPQLVMESVLLEWYDLMKDAKKSLRI